MAEDIVQVIADTRLDSKTMQEVVNGDADTQITSRLGESYPSVQKAIKLMTQSGVGFTAFETKALMTASSLANGSYAIVANDTTTNNGLHLKKSGAWSKVSYDVDARQKEYADAARDSAVSAAAADATTKADDAKNEAINAAATDATSKADEARDSAVSAAAADATTKADDAKNEAINAAATDATSKADEAKSEAVTASTAITDSRLSAIDAMRVNTGKNYPLKSIPRNNVTSAPRVELNNALLDVKVYGALPDHYYRIAYIKNGLTSLGDYPYGVQIDEMPIAGYENSNVASTIIINYIDPAPDLPRGGIHTQVIKSPHHPDFEVHLTFDTDKLPPVGGYINLKDEGNAAWSWVIDPSNYNYIPQRTGVYYKVDSDLNVSFEYQSGLYLYRVTFGKNGFNNLPNIRKIERCVVTRKKNWTTISETDTDYLPPMVFKALNNGDVDATSIYTGGNHGTSGAAGGNQTARNVYYKIAANGQELSAGSSGYAESVDLFIINELMAYNTVSTGRYAIRQAFKVELKKSQVIVTADIHALEDIEIATDNGLQLYTGGYQGTQLIVGGQDTTRVAFKDNTNSGLKTNAPHAFALVLQNQFDQVAMWMDREYEAGDTRYVPNSATLMRAGSGTSTKWYNAIIANTAQQITANSSYKWRGGYSIERKASITGYDSVFSKDDGFVVAVDASNYSIVD